MIQKLLALTAFLVATIPHLRAAAPEHSFIESKVFATDKIAKVELKVITKAAIVVNDAEDAPWQLTLSELNGATATQTTFGKDKLDKALPGYKIELTPTAPAWSAHYKVIAFVCTKAKDKCFREVHSGIVSQTAKPTVAGLVKKEDASGTNANPKKEAKQAKTQKP